ncbi:hypothetical protein RZN25_14425 [Bacillaceae bacterium S4-13-56]
MINRARKVTDFSNFINLLNIPDFDMLITLAVGSRQYIHPDIQGFYEQNKSYYFRLFKESPYYNNERITCLSISNYKAIQQFIGIYLDEKEHAAHEITLKLIKKGYKQVYNYMKNKQVVDLYELRDTYLDYVKKKRLRKSVHSAHIFGIALYFCRELDIQIVYDDLDVELMNGSFAQIFNPLKNEFSISEHAQDFLERYKHIGAHKKDFFSPLNNFLIDINSIHQEIVAEELNLNINLQSHLEQIQEIMAKHPFMIGINKISLMLQEFNIHPVDLQNITTITHDQLKEIITFCLIQLGENYTEEDLYEMFGSYLILFSLAKDYSATKERYIVQFSDELFYEVNKVKKEYESKFEQVEKEEGQKETKIQRLENQNEKLKSTIFDLEKQASKKNNTIEELLEKIRSIEGEQNRLESKLKDFEKLLTTSREDPPIQEMVDYLNSKKGVVIGGTDNWRAKLAQHFPGYLYFSPEDKNIDLDFLKNYDCIIYDETYNNHTMSNKIKPIIANHNIPMIYTGGITNADLIIKKVYQELMC